mgnify:CR=1 FL=1
MIAVWGSPGSGTTLTAVKIARELCQKHNVVLVLGDNEVPTVPLLVPQADSAKSLGDLLVLPSMSQIDLFRHCIPVGKSLSLMGYLYGENEKTWPDYSVQRVRELIELLRNSADYVVIDCPHHLLSSILTAVVLEEADLVLRVVNADLKSLIFVKSQRPFLSESRFRWEDHVSIINNVLHTQDTHTYEETFGGKAYTLPHLPALQEQYDEYRLLEPVTGREGKLYEPLIRAIGSVK